jgi:hypothetical protein
VHRYAHRPFLAGVWICVFEHNVTTALTVTVEIASIDEHLHHVLAREVARDHHLLPTGCIIVGGTNTINGRFPVAELPYDHSYATW